MVNIRSVEKLEETCLMKQSRQFRPRSVKCRKRIRTANKNKNTTNPFVRCVLHWCPCFCCCKTRKKRVFPKSCVNSERHDELLVNQMCFQCSDKGLTGGMLTKNFDTIVAAEKKSKRTRGSSKCTPEDKYEKTMFDDDEIAKGEPISSTERRRAAEVVANEEKAICYEPRHKSKPGSQWFLKTTK